MPLLILLHQRKRKNYNAIKYKPGDRSLGEQGLKKLAEVLDLTYNTILDWYEGRF